VTIAMVLATAAILLLGWEVRRVLTWIVVAALLSIILGPVTDLVERRLHLRRSLATLLVFLLGFVLLVGVVTVFVRPIAKEGPQFIDRAPEYVAQAEAGRGPVGSLIKRYQVAEYVTRNQARLREAGSRLTTPALAAVRTVFATIVGLVTILVLTFLMVLQGPTLVASWLAARPRRCPGPRSPRWPPLGAEQSQAPGGSGDVRIWAVHRGGDCHHARGQPRLDLSAPHSP
jgi:predicted PurR-regulated permease PerM